MTTYLELRIPFPKTTLSPAELLGIGQSDSFQVQDKVHTSNTLNKVLQDLKYTLREFPCGLEVKKLS